MIVDSQHEPRFCGSTRPCSSHDIPRETQVSRGAALKFDAGKPRISLVPVEAIEAMARVLTHGAAKYSDHNWRQGFAWSRLADATLRHLLAFMRGEDNDPETGESHLAHALCCLSFLYVHAVRKLGEDDRVK